MIFTVVPHSVILFLGKSQFGGLLLEVKMQCNARRDLFTSLVGTVPLADGEYGTLLNRLTTNGGSHYGQH